MLTDYDIRKILMKKIKYDNKNKSYRIIEEQVISNGQARIDIAVSNGKLIGYEIKSDHDSLSRLDNQIKHYNKTFENITIIVGKKFEHVIKSRVPSYWGIMVAYKDEHERINIQKVRESKSNGNISKPYVLELLWN